MANKRIIIIGAGISGLSAGVFGQINGFDTEIYEMHSLPGGECTGWDRGEYHFDGCIHYLMGSTESSPAFSLWQKVGALDDSVEIINNELFYSFSDGKDSINIFKNTDALEVQLLEKAPEDLKLIQKMCRDIRALQSLDIPTEKPIDMYSFIDYCRLILGYFPFRSIIKYYSKMDVIEFSSMFSNILLRKAILNSMPSRNIAFNLICVLASMNIGDNNWPKGGSRAMAKRMERKYSSLGGKVHYRSKVDSIVIENGNATGVILENGEIINADKVISTIDAHYCLSKLLKGEYSDKKYDLAFEDICSFPLETSVQVSFGVGQDLSKNPHYNIVELKNPIKVGNVANEFLRIRHYCYDSTIAPEGKSVVTILMDTDYNFWHEASNDRNNYKRLKEELATSVATALADIYPETIGKIENVDVTTPKTYEKFCNAYKGSYMSWINTPNSRTNSFPMKIKGLGNFYLSGQWTSITGGLILSMLSGKWSIQHLCKDSGVEFYD